MNKLSLILLAALVSLPAAADSISREHNVNREVVSQADPGAKELMLRRATLGSGQTFTLPVTLTAGKVYTFFGDCDENCTNMDMTLSRGSQTVAKDLLDDPQPLFSYRAARSGTYTVKVPMRACDANRCALTVHVFEGSKMIYESVTR